MTDVDGFDFAKERQRLDDEGRRISAYVDRIAAEFEKKPSRFLGMAFALFLGAILATVVVYRFQRA